MTTAIILAGGTGSRVGADVPKQFIEVFDKPVLVYTIEIYQQHPEVDAIEVVCHPQYIDYLKELVQKYNLTKVCWVTDGGDTFQESCLNGINDLEDKLADDDMILIHYGAAPFTSQKIVTDAIRVCNEKGNAVSGIPCYQLMGTRNEGEVSEEWVDRDKFIQITCPYAFKYGFVKTLYKEAIEKNLLDKVEPHTTTLMQYMGHKLYLSYGDQTNIKITTKEDVELFKGYVLMKNMNEQNNSNYEIKLVNTMSFNCSEHVWGLINAILNVSKKYMFYYEKIEVKEDKIVEQIERVFAYELCHQWSLLKDTNLMLNGEIDKDEEKNRYYPDMVLHGGQCDHDNNKVVVEIKRGKDIDNAKIIKDLEKLSPYLSQEKNVKYANYENAVFILFGENMEKISEALKSYNGEDIKHRHKIICITYNYDGNNNKYTLEIARMSDLNTGVNFSHPINGSISEVLHSLKNFISDKKN